MQKSICVDLFAHRRVRNLGQVQRYRVRNVHTPLVDRESWRTAKNWIAMPEREAVISEETGSGKFSEYNFIKIKEDIDV